MAISETFTPFVEAESFVQDADQPPPTAPAWSPFVSAYEAPDHESEVDEPLREAYTTVVNALYDEEFDESLYELLTSAQGLHENRLASGLSREESDRVVAQHFSQLAREADAMLDAMARELGARDAATLDQEIDQFGERYAPAVSLEPEFQNFLGKLVKKVVGGLKTAAKVAAKGLATLGLGPILNRIKALVRPLLNRVLQKAIGRLPVAVRPAATALAQRLGLVKKPAARAPAPATTPVAAASIEPPAADTAPAAADASAAGASTADASTADASTGSAASEPAPSPEDAGSSVHPSAGNELPDLQLEFDELVAEAMLSDDDTEMALELARADTPADSTEVYAYLDRARERFAQELEQLREGENPAPHVENFLPAVLPALRIGIRLAGRPRVVRFLAGLLGRLIGRLVGPKQTPALSQAIVDAGLRLVNLEVADDERARLATSAVTTTVEETLARVASLPDHILDNDELLEAFALEAFEQAAAANLPAVFPEPTYRRRPELLEGGVNATWLALPLRRPRYKRCSRRFNVTITPQLAEAIESFEDATLAEYLQDQLGVEDGDSVEAEVRLFEVLPGGTAADITRHEQETPGLGGADEATLSQLHPLTHEAAGALLGRPALGRPLHAGSNVRSLPAGQRVFHLAARRRPLTVATRAGNRRVRRLARVDAVLDIVADQIRVCVFLSEVKAQRLAVRLRQQSHVGALTVAFRKLLARRLPSILRGRRGRRLRIVHAGVAPGTAPASLLDRLPAIVSQALVANVQEWLTTAFAGFVRTQAQAFLTASEDPADGVTIRFTIERPPGLKELGLALSQRAPAAPGIAGRPASTPAPPAVRVDALPGYRRD
jgi:hypothetical protein